MEYLNKVLTIAFLLFSSALMAQSPCSSLAHSEFDFWLGEWEVYHTQADTLVGRNHIKKILNNCVVEENWTGASGFQGKSFNTYNPVDSTWNQVWVDMGGSTYHFTGRFKENVMQMYGETTNAQGKLVKLDMAYFFDKEKDTVRQVWKMSQDKGESWNVVFDGIYRKKKKG